MSGTAESGAGALVVRPPFLQRPGTAHAGLMLTMFCWGSLTPAFWVLLESFDAWSISALRFLLATPILFAMLRWREGPLRLGRGTPWGRLTLLGSLGLGGLATGYTMGVALSTPVSAIVMQACGPIVGAAVARVLTRTPLPRGIGIALACVTAGALLTMAPQLTGADAGLRGGEMLILLGSVAWSWYSVKAQQWLVGWSQLRITALTTLPTAVFLCIMMELAHAAGVQSLPFSAATPQAVGLLVVLAITASALGTLFWHNGVQRVGLPIASLYLNLIPVFAMLIATLLGIVPSPGQLVGVALVLFGVWYVGRRR